MTSETTRDPALAPAGPPPLLDYPLGAAYLRLSKRKLSDLVAQREVAHIKLGTRIWFRREDLDDYLDRCRTPALAEFHTGTAAIRSR